MKTGISRVGFGPEQAYSSRYITVPSLILIAATVVLLKIVELSQGAEGKRARTAALTLLAIVTTLLATNYVSSVQQVREDHPWVLEGQRCLREAQNEQAPCLASVYPDQHVLWERIQFLRTVHWGGQ
jgi:hypothetical protein